MSKRSRRTGGAHRAAGRRPSAGASSRVGYGRPPKEHQFRRGQSGNRKGRPNGAITTTTLLRKILDRRVEVRSGSTARTISVREAILTRFAEICPQGRHQDGGVPVATLRHAGNSPGAGGQRYDAG